jgi:hypothetical protein
MKRSHLVSASVIALTAALIVGSASAASSITVSKSNSDARTTTLSGSKSNTSEKIGTAAGTTEADCTKAGGKVETDKDGAKRCKYIGETEKNLRTGTTTPAPASPH